MALNDIFKFINNYKNVTKYFKLIKNKKNVKNI